MLISSDATACCLSCFYVLCLKGMAAPVLLLVYICSANLIWRVSSNGPGRLECPAVNLGIHGQDLRIRCSVSVSSGLNIFGALWKRVHLGGPLSTVSFLGTKGGDGSHFESGWSKSRMEAWLLVKNIQVDDSGRYTCFVLTNRGSLHTSTSLSVIARYSKPTIWSEPERDIKDDMEVSVFCRAQGGFPRGTIHWFDQYGTNWTRSSETEALERRDGLFDLTSEYHLRRAHSLSPGYRCCVIQGDGSKEEETEILLAFRDSGKQVQRWSNNSIVAIIVVAGSLTTGLLFLVLLQRRRPQSE
ncbi:hypothetical protein GJAV_G00223720 [Gymnothorax javanicus]|nr:hypothetical protein GJAV_G00223720 [Gymnothorax javanicus]